MNRIKWRICKNILCPPPHLRSETDPGFETLCSVLFRTQDGGRSPKKKKKERISNCEKFESPGRIYGNGQRHGTGDYYAEAI
jgi:hypothetical protein